MPAHNGQRPASLDVEVTTSDLAVMVGLITLTDVRTVLEAGFSEAEVEYMLDLVDGQVARWCHRPAA